MGGFWNRPPQTAHRAANSLKEVFKDAWWKNNTSCLRKLTRHQVKVTRHLFLPFIVNEDIRNVIVKTLTSIKLKGHKAKNLNILFILQNLQGTFAESTRHHWRLYLVQVYSFYRIYKAPLQNLQGTTGNCALYKAFTIHPIKIIWWKISRSIHSWSVVLILYRVSIWVSKFPSLSAV